MLSLVLFLSDLERPAPVIVVFVQQWASDLAVRVVIVLVIRPWLLFPDEARLEAVGVEKPADERYFLSTLHSSFCNLC